jgi:hypothetical protein
MFFLKAKKFAFDEINYSLTTIRRTKYECRDFSVNKWFDAGSLT